MEDKAKKMKKFIRGRFEPILMRLLSRKGNVIPIPPQLRRTSNNPDTLLVIYLNDELEKNHDEAIEEIEYILAIDWNKDDAWTLFLESRKRREGLRKEV